MLSSSTTLSDQTVLLEAGKPAPFTGYLLPPDQAALSRIRLIEGEEAKKMNESYARSIETYRKNEELGNQQVNILLERNDNLSKQLSSSQSLTDFQKVAYFIGGVLLTGGAVYGASKLAK